MTPDQSITFASLQLAAPLQRALADKAYTHPSPIQAQAIPLLLDGRDVIGIAQTGTGKTAAFALPMLHRLSTQPKPIVARQPRALILTPTRELAAQIAENIALYGRYLQLRHTVIFGGVGEQPQIRQLAAGVDIVVATPGRLLDLMEQRCLALDRVEFFVLDEADRMLDMGFAPSVKRVLAKLPARRQSLLFSATMPETIRSLASAFLRDPVRVEVSPVASTAERIDQRVCHVDAGNKPRLLVHLLETHPEGLALVFSRTKHGANRIAKNLVRDGIPADAIHGNKSQGARERALAAFRNGTLRVLVATDIAARGIDVKGIGLVVNFDLPNEPESYVHRIGRTARAGADGLAIALCSAEERSFLRDIQRLIRREIPVFTDHPFPIGSAVPRPAPADRAPHGHRNHSSHARPAGRSHSNHGSAPSPAARPAGHAPAAAKPAAHSPLARGRSWGFARPGGRGPSSR
ncbi:DEAD/DEAH box helicase [Horticoccus luteus]|uniref:DEAD-box ATP-dependent RNA helicase RhpA n=1 Tax=Horticoccus luteus TaxID=2862869 RepID=A0A8F9TTD6_9BACT|nr:DEAD/DEAH box helicase [Horticoccus luteus]QYM77953.1 DEAD/DEAH box helicase [Horticoccus luteus]